MIESFKWTKGFASDDALKIRKIVFIDEQGVLPEEEYDGSDKYSESVVLYLNGDAAATGRIIIGERGECLAGRVACLKEYRGRGCGSILMKEIMRRCVEKGFDEIHVHSQVRAEGFYASLGFEAYGDIYMEANIVHINMKKNLKI